METLRFLTPEQAGPISDQFGTPVFVYDERTLKKNAENCLRFPNAYGLTVRYAMKASSNAAILKTFEDLGLYFDASSGFEVERALRAEIAPEKISLSSQEYPRNLGALCEKGIAFNASSLNQIRRFGELHSGGELGIRFNPGLGSGSTNRTNTGGPSSSFGIWYEYVDEVHALLEECNLTAVRLHTHIGSGVDPTTWQRAARLSLDLAAHFPTVDTLNLGGGYKVARMAHEEHSDLIEIGRSVREAFVSLFEETGRKLQLEIEPGTYLIANACSLLTTIQDIVTTGEEGYTFLKLDSGMSEILRPSHYGAEHPIIVISANPTGETREYVVVGHCCESGDLLTTAPGDPELLAPRELAEASIGDLCVIEGAGAYCSSMPAKNYNSFPEASEALLRESGRIAAIRKRQTLDQILQNEMPLGSCRS